MPSPSTAIDGPAPSPSGAPSRTPWPGPARTTSATIAFPALGTGVGGYPIDEAAQITLATVRAELPRSPSVEVVTFALRGAAAYAAFQAALHGEETRQQGALERGGVR